MANGFRSWMTYFFKRKFDLPEGNLGSIFFVTNLICSASTLVASAIAKRIGNVKVFHILQVSLQEEIILILNIDNGLHTPSVGNRPLVDSRASRAAPLTDVSHPTLLFAIDGRGASQRVSGCCTAQGPAHGDNGRDQCGQNVHAESGAVVNRRTG